MEESEARTLDLSLLWEVIDKHRQEKEGLEESNSKWELVVIQAVLLTLLILVAIIWAACCRRNCCRPGQDQLSVAEALRKISRDLPPSYSKVSQDQCPQSPQHCIAGRPQESRHQRQRLSQPSPRLPRPLHGQPPVPRPGAGPQQAGQAQLL